MLFLLYHFLGFISRKEFTKYPIYVNYFIHREKYEVEKNRDVQPLYYIDGMLHIQTAVSDELENDNHGSFYLKKSNGENVNCNYNFNFQNKYEQYGRIEFCEYVFDVPQEEIGQYSLYGDFVTSGMHTKGSWRVTFPLEAAK